MTRINDEYLRGLALGRAKCRILSKAVLTFVCVAMMTISGMSQLSDCDFFSDDVISVSVQNHTIDHQSDSVIFILVSSSNIIIEINDEPTFSPPEIPGDYSVEGIQFKKESTSISGLKVEGSITDVSLEGCFDWSDPLNISICNCKVDDTSDDIVLCPEEIYEMGDLVISSAGQYSYTFLTSAGCDSTVFLDVLMPSLDTISQSAQICNNTISFGGETISQSGTYYLETVNEDGCPEIQKLIVTEGEFIDLVLSQSYHPCAYRIDQEFDTQNHFFLSQNYEITQYLLTSSEGEIIQIQNGSKFSIDSTGVYTFYALTYNEETDFSNFSIGQNIQSIQICGDYLISTPYGIEVCSACDNSNIDLVVSICKGDSYLFGSQTLSNAGIYQDTFLTNKGCDSIVLLTLNIANPQDTIHEYKKVCTGDSLFYGGEYRHNDGIYYSSNEVNDCNVTTVLHLEVEENIEIDIPQLFEECLFEEGESISFDIVTPAEADSTVFVLSTADGTIVQILNNPVFTSLSQGEYFVFAISYDHTTEINGLSLGANVEGIKTCGCATINVPYGFEVCVACPDEITEIEASICQGESYPFGSIILNEEGIYYDTISIDDGRCDSLIQLNLSLINNQDSIHIFETICSGDVYDFGGNTISEEGTYHHSELLSECQVTYVLHLTVDQGLIVDLGSEFESCAFYSDELIELSLSDVPLNSDFTTFILTTEEGTILQIKDDLSFSNPDQGRYLVYALSYDLSTYLSGMSEGENILDLKICGCADISTPYGFEVCAGCEDVFIAYDYGICYGESYLFGDKIISEPGEYLDTIDQSGQCDSIIRLTLYHFNQDTISEMSLLCPGDSILFDGSYISESGIYYKNENISGCQQVTKLEVGAEDCLSCHPDTTIINQILCNGDTLIYKGEEITQPGEYVFEELTDDCLIVTLLKIEVKNAQLINMNSDIVPCFFTEHDDITFSNPPAVLAYDNTFYILTDEIGTILEIAEIPYFYKKSKGKYMLYTLSFDDVLMINGIDAGKNIESLKICGPSDISYPYGFEVCTGCHDQYTYIQIGLCSEGFYPFDNQMINAPGVYYDTIPLSVHCDSIIELTLYESTADTTHAYAELCPGETIDFFGASISEEGVYYSIDSEYGCDKVSMLHVNIAQTVNFHLSTKFESCAFYEGETLQFKESAIAHNADSTIYILTDESGLILEIKDDLTFQNRSQGKYTAYALSVDDDTEIKDLATGKNVQDAIICGCADVSDPYGFEICSECIDPFRAIEVGICFDETYEFAGQELSEQGVYYDTMKISFDCDSVIQLTLYHLNEDTIHITEQICDRDSFLFNGMYLSEGGDYIQKKDTLNCEQFTVLHLQVDKSITPVISDTFDPCYIETGETINLSSEQHNASYSEVSYVLTSQYGNIIRISQDAEIQINQPGKYNVFMLSYESDAEMEGLAIDNNILNLMSCGDSEISDPLSFEVCGQCEDEFFAIESGICFGEVFEFGGNLIEEAGVYFDTLITEGNCLSVTRLNLIHHNEDTIRTYRTICEGSDSILFFGSYFTEAGDYYFTESDEIHGCHQAYALHLSVDLSEDFTLADSYDKCEFYLGENITFSVEENNSEPEIITRYILADEDGNIIDIQNEAFFNVDQPGQLQIIPISYDSLSTLVGIEIGRNLLDASFCGCTDVGKPYGFEICDPSCDTIRVELKETICFTEPFVLGDLLLDESGLYRDTLRSSVGCDSIVTLDLTVNGGYIYTDLPLEYESCVADTETPVILTFEEENTQCGSTTTYVLVDEDGIIHSLKNRPHYLGLSPGKYAVYPVHYPQSSPPANLTIFSNITRLGTCSCVEISPPQAFEICSPCPAINIDKPISYEQCGFMINRDYSFYTQGGTDLPSQITKFIITDSIGFIVQIRDDSQLNLKYEGHYEAYVLSYEEGSEIFGLKEGSNISGISICGCYDLSAGYGFEVCDNTYDLALKYYLEGSDSQNLYSDIPAIIRVVNQGEGAISSFGLVNYLPIGLTLSENDPHWTLSNDSMAIREITKTLHPGDTLDIQILVRSTGSAYDLYLQSVIGTAEITHMRDVESVLVEDVDSRPDSIRTNDNGSYEETDDWCDDNGEIDEDDHDFVQIKFRYIDPTGWIYCEKTGEIITGGKISVSGPGNVRILKDGSTGEYQYLADSTGLYILTITHPNGYPLSLSCNVNQDTFYIDQNEGNPLYDRDGISNDTVLMGSEVIDGQLLDNTCEGNPFFDHLYFDVDGPSMLVNNNIPVQCIGAVTIKCDGTGDNPYIDVLNDVKVELFSCSDTLNPIDSTFTYGGGGFEFTSIEDVGCYRVKVNENKDFNVEANEDISPDGWSREIRIEWGSCDSIVFACFSQCDLIPLEIGAPTQLDTCAFEIGSPIDLAQHFEHTGKQDTTLFILSDTTGRIIEITDVPEFSDPGIGDYFGYGIDLKGLKNIQGLEVDSLFQNVRSCPRDSAFVYGPFSVSVCGFFDLALRKKVSSKYKGPIKPFSHVPFTITVYNQGRIGARQVEVIEHFPKGMTLSEKDRLWTLEDDSTATYIIPGMLEPGDSIDLEIVTYITPYVMRHGIENLVNIAEVAGAKDSLNREIQDVDSTPDRLIYNDNGGMAGDGTDDEIHDDGTMDEDDSDPEEIKIDPLDPQGYIYCSKTGQIITGGTISVSGPGNVDMIMDGSDGAYQFFVDSPGEYTITYNHPSGYPIDPGCTEIPGIFDPTDKDGDPEFDQDSIENLVLTMGSDSSGGFLIDNSCDANPYFLKIQIDPDDPPLIAQNNIPVSCIVIASIVCSSDDLSGELDGGESGLEGIEVSLYSCTDTLNPITITSTDINGGYSFPQIDNPGCYRVRFAETPDFNVIANDVVDEDGWSTDVMVDWGDCDSTISVCFTVCDILPPVALADTLIICGSDDIPVLSVLVNENETAYWYDAPSGGFLLATDTSSFTPPAAGTYYAETKYIGTTCHSKTRTAVTLMRYPDIGLVALPIQALCDGTYGSVELHTYSQTGPFEIMWYNENGDTSTSTTLEDNFTIERLLQGGWNIEVTDVNGCISSDFVTITAPLPMICNIDLIKDVSCPGDHDGMISASAQGGTAPYTFTLAGETNTTGTFSNLTPGSYAIIVEDNNFCSNICVVSIGEPDTLQCMMTIDSQPRCDSGSGGEITMRSTGGTGQKWYVLEGDTNTTGVFTDIPAGTYYAEVFDENGCYSQCAFILHNSDTDLECSISITKDLSCAGVDDAEILVTAITEGQSSAVTYTLNGVSNSDGVFKGLAAGVHTVTIFDDSGCTSSCSVLIEDQSDFSCNIQLLSSPSCGDMNGGAIEVFTNLQGTLSYSLNNNPGQISNSFSGLAPGSHFIRVTDENGCETSCIINIDSPDDLFCVVGERRDVSCTGGSDGMFTVRSFQGTPPFSYSINDGPYTTQDTFENLSDGEYSIKVRDVNGCESECSVMIESPQELACTSTVLQGPLCAGSYSGSIQVSAIGGVSPYQYRINSGSFGDESLFENLRAGTYIIEILDAKGCISQCTQVIEDPLGLTCIIDEVKSTSCEGARDGSILMSVSGGEGPYTYLLADQVNNTGVFEGLPSGFLNIIVTDNNECSSVCLIEIPSGTIDDLQMICDGDNELDLGCSPDTIVSGEYLIENGFITSGSVTADIRIVSEVNYTQGCDHFRSYQYVAMNALW